MILSIVTVASEICEEYECHKHGNIYYHHEEMDAGY